MLKTKHPNSLGHTSHALLVLFENYPFILQPQAQLTTRLPNLGKKE